MQARPLTDVEQMLRNEYLKINRAIEQRQALIKSLEQKVKQKKVREMYPPRWYSVEFDFTPGDLQPQERSFTVDAAAPFRPYVLQSSLRIIGEANVSAGIPTAGQVMEITLPWGPTPVNGSTRNSYFDYLWEIRDTGSDREWQDRPQPSLFMASNSLTPLHLPLPSEVAAGSEVFVNVDPFFSAIPVAGAGIFFSISTYKLHISFFGTEKI